MDFFFLLQCHSLEHTGSGSEWLKDCVAGGMRLQEPSMPSNQFCYQPNTVMTKSPLYFKIKQTKHDHSAYYKHSYLCTVALCIHTHISIWLWLLKDDT